MSSPVPPRSQPSVAKEYARFCRLRRLFLAEGLHAWRQAMEQRNVPPEEIRAKISEAARYVEMLGRTLEAG